MTLIIFFYRVCVGECVQFTLIHPHLWCIHYNENCTYGA